MQKCIRQTSIIIFLLLSNSSIFVVDSECLVSERYCLCSAVVHSSKTKKNRERNKIDDLFLDFCHVPFVICGSKWQIAIVLSHDFVSIHLKHVAIDAVPLHTNGFSSEFQVENMQIHFSHSRISTWNEIFVLWKTKAEFILHDFVDRRMKRWISCFCIYLQFLATVFLLLRAADGRQSHQLFSHQISSYQVVKILNSRQMDTLITMSIFLLFTYSGPR